MVALACNNANIWLLVIFLLSNCDWAYSDEFPDNVEIPTSENVTRPEVRTPQGTVLGVNMVTRHNRTFFAFKGIPFAQPPVGNLRFAIIDSRVTVIMQAFDTNRFKAPLPAYPWNGTLDGSWDSNECPQFDGDRFVGDEDCLYLNVYTPRLPVGENSTLLPVMMFVYGGAYQTGTNNPRVRNPKFILDKDVVLVVPSYRMGVLGYLSTGDEVSPGNYGLKDLVLALKWIQHNIRSFAGDPNQVTVFGGSSGAGCIDLLPLSNLTEGLFHRYIVESSSALAPETVQPTTQVVNHAIRLGTHLGCPINTSTCLVNCLRGFNARQLVDTNSIFYQWNVHPFIIWGPTVEPDIENAFLTDMPVNLFAAGKIRDLPSIHHLVPTEGIVTTGVFYGNPDLFQELLDNLDSVLPFMLRYDGRVANVPAYTAALKSYYLNDLSSNRTSLLTNVTQLIGDAMFIHPGYSEIQKLQLIQTKNPHYFSYFEYRGTLSNSYFYSGGSTKNMGVAHGDELIYLIPRKKTHYGPPHHDYSKSDWSMVDTMVQLWTSFAIDGTPTTSGLNSTVVWEPYSLRESYLQIGNGPDPGLAVGHDFLKDRMRFWEELDAATSWL